ncbi:hypothetical protein M885DRAFT_515600 [Pelagophyceae sp. CCMP2097]|nr:hypothetical protein M885DRAFT_515600 [Pelagophyceae sp. CCMP2097]
MSPCLHALLAGLACASALAPPAVARLRSHVEKQGAEFGPFDVVECDGDRKVVATTSIAAGAEIMRLPRACLVVNGDAGDAGPSDDLVGPLDNADSLALWILQNPQSPLVASFPTKADLRHLPVLWCASDAERLAGSGVGEDLRLRLLHDDAVYTGNAILRTLCHHDPSTWRWAKACVRSRALGVPAGEDEEEEESEESDDWGEFAEGIEEDEDDSDALDALFDGGLSDDDLISAFEAFVAENSNGADNGASPTLANPRRTDLAALAPMADMLNHRRLPNCEWGSESDGDFIVRCARDCLLGDELTISYGDLSPSRSLLNYGFIADQGPREAELAVSLPGNASQAVRAVWGGESLLRHVYVSDASSAHSLLSLCRIASASEEEVMKLGGAGEAALRPLSHANERLALNMFQNAATPNEAFESVSDPSGRNAAAAAKVVAVEREALLHWRNVASDAIHLLHSTDLLHATDIDDATETLHATDATDDSYAARLDGLLRGAGGGGGSTVL